MLQLANHTQRIAVSLLTVVDDDEREARIRLHVARIRRRLFDKPQPVFPAASEAGKAGQQAQRR